MNGNGGFGMGVTAPVDKIKISASSLSMKFETNYIQFIFQSKKVCEYNENERKLSIIKIIRSAEVDPRIFGGFLEHMGRAVYEGVYDPESAHADPDGFRIDVLEAMKPMQYTAMRYPGGNFASGYHWMDGIGPKEERPTVRELAWQSLEPNQFGTDEFVKLSRMMDWIPMMTVNLGTGTPEEATQLGGILQQPYRQPILKYARSQRLAGSVRSKAVVPGKRNGRPLAAWACSC